MADLAEMAAALSELDEARTLEMVERALEGGTSPLDIVEALRRGMQRVGELFASKEYFVPDLILSAEIFKQAMELVKPRLAAAGEGSRGIVVLGTVQGDIHDIGKNIVNTMLACHGFQVRDLGVDVPPERFVEEIRVSGSRVLGLSCLLTTGFPGLRRTIEALQEAGLRDRVRVMVGGGAVTQEVCQMVGADAYGRDAVDAVELARRFMREG